MCQKSPTFMYWDFILRYETLILIFVRAHREKKFLLYVEVLEKLTPLFFALDHVNYSRWIPVHIRGMKFLPSAIRDQFETQGHWVLSKTNNKFSAIPIDQAHEQENAFVKGSGGCDLQRTLLHLGDGCYQDQSWLDCKGNLRKSTFLILAQTIQGILRIISRDLQHRRHFRCRLPVYSKHLKEWEIPSLTIFQSL